jgi:hypothetical protein
MGEFLLELWFLFAEVIFEALFEFAREAVFDLIFRAIATLERAAIGDHRDRLAPVLNT